VGVAPGFGAVEEPVAPVAGPTISGNSSISDTYSAVSVTGTTGLDSAGGVAAISVIAGAWSTAFNAALDASAR